MLCPTAGCVIGNSSFLWRVVTMLPAGVSSSECRTCGNAVEREGRMNQIICPFVVQVNGRLVDWGRGYGAITPSHLCL
jgi:hypothetical protein